MRGSRAVVMAVLASCGGHGNVPDEDAANTTVSVIRTPTPAWRHEPLRFTLSPAVRPETVTSESVRVMVGASSIASQVTAVTQADGRTGVEIVLDWGSPEAQAPVDVTVTLAPTIVGMNGEPFAGDTWSVTYPAWPATEVAPVALRSAPSIAIAPDGSARIVYVAGDPDTAGASRVELESAPRSWPGVGDFINGYAWSDAGIVVDAQGRISIAWIDADSPNGINGTLHVRRDDEALKGTMYILPAVIPITRIRLLQRSGTLVVAWAVQGTFRAARWDDATSEWTRIAELTPIGGVADFDLTFDGTTAVLAYVLGANPDGIHVAKQLGYASWSEATPQYRGAPAVWDPAITTASGVAYVGWRQPGTLQDDALTARVELSTMAVTAVAGQLEELAADEVGGFDLVTSPTGEVYAALTQAGAVTLRRATSTGWETLGSNVATGTSVAIAVDGHGHPVIAYGGDWSAPAPVGITYGNNVSSP